MKEITGNKRVTDGPLPNLVRESNREIFDKKETAERFNRCFVNIGPNLAVSIPENNTSFENYSHFTTALVSPILRT